MALSGPTGVPATLFVRGFRHVPQTLRILLALTLAAATAVPPRIPDQAGDGARAVHGGGRRHAHAHLAVSLTTPEAAGDRRKLARRRRHNRYTKVAKAKPDGYTY